MNAIKSFVEALEQKTTARQDALEQKLIVQGETTTATLDALGQKLTVEGETLARV